MEYQDQVNIINDIERSIPVDLITYRGIRIWPIIRLAIWQNIFDRPENLSGSGKNKSFLKKLARFFLKRFFPKKISYQKADAVFLIAPNERRIKIQDKYYSPFSNSLQDLFGELNIPSAALDLAKKRLPVYGETYFIDEETVDSPVTSKLAGIWKKYFSGSQNEIIGWEKLTDYMASVCPEYIPEKSAIVDYCENMLRHENIFTRILKQIKPRVGFLVCYYHPAAMGYIRACRKLGIKTVDIQHGDQYGMYRNWDNLPQGGYDILPSSFWCWGKTSADEINRWSHKAHPEHKAFVGGNPWISSFISPSPASSGPTSGINVLVVLTNLAYPVSNIVSAIKDSPDLINWVIRPHPAMPNEIEKFISVKNKISVDESPLVFETLKKADFIITPCSTVAYEALLFKVHPIITHGDGKEKFKSYIDKGLFSYAETAEEILKTLQKEKNGFNFKEEIPYMETNQEMIKNNILNLI